jgi:hypothetical protein
MEDVKTISWIFLAASLASEVTPAKLESISTIADGINHAVPTQKELQYSIRWLTIKNLVVKESGKYFLSEDGRKLIKQAKNKSNLLISIWKDLENSIKPLDHNL